jgi:hypothetical protein
MAIIKPNNNTLSSITALPTGLGGKVLQVVTAAQSTEQSSSSQSYVSCNTTVDITPSATSSKILVTVAGTGRQNNASDSTFFTIFRDSTNLEATSDKGFSQTGALSGTRVLTGISINFLDSPSSTSELTYALYMKSSSGGNARSSVAGSTTTITVMEIAG